MAGFASAPVSSVLANIGFRLASLTSSLTGSTAVQLSRCSRREPLHLSRGSRMLRVRLARLSAVPLAVTANMSGFTVYSPLSRFEWDGDSHQIAPGLEVIRRPAFPYPLRDLDEGLTRFEKDELFFADHWLRLAWRDGSDPSAAENVNLFLLALWVEQPTRAHVKFRFCVNDDQGEAPGGMSRLFDQFQWIEGGVTDKVSTPNLATAGTLFPLMRNALVTRHRLSNALYLTFSGCNAIQWQVALACYAAAAEALLTYKTGKGITQRLASAFAVLMDTAPAARDDHFNDFRDLYSKRSDVMHGRGHLIPAADRLPVLARFGDALRSLWRTVLLSQPATQALEGTDAQRRVFFQTQQGAWVPPK